MKKISERQKMTWDRRAIWGQQRSGVTWRQSPGPWGQSEINMVMLIPVCGALNRVLSTWDEVFLLLAVYRLNGAGFQCLLCCVCACIATATSHDEWRQCSSSRPLSLNKVQKQWSARSEACSRADEAKTVAPRVLQNCPARRSKGPPT